MPTWEFDKSWHYKGVALYGVLNGEIIRQNKGEGIPPQHLNACRCPYIYDIVIKIVFRFTYILYYSIKLVYLPQIF